MTVTNETNEPTNTSDDNISWWGGDKWTFMYVTTSR